MTANKALGYLYRAAATLLFCVLGHSGAQAQQRWEALHAAVQLTAGATDEAYPGCRGVMFAFAGGSVEAGAPLFAEAGIEAAGVGGDDCQTTAITPRGNHLPPIGDEPSARYWLGAGRRFAGDHFLFAARLGQFNNGETWLSAKATASIFHLTFGLEVGQIHARWEFEDGSQFERWSRFGGWSIGLRL